MEIAVLGTGKVAERNYLPSLLRHPDVSLTCYSRTLERAEAVGRKFGVRVARTLEELFERGPAAVFVLTLEGQRLEATRSLLPFKPRRLFFEKPLVARNGQAKVEPQDFWDAKNLLQEAAAAGSKTAMVFNYRFFDQSQRAKQLIQERRFGPVSNVVALTHFACWSHCIDLILQFAGPVVEISAQESAQTHTSLEIPTVPDVAAAFKTDAGGSGALLGTNGMDWNFPLFELIFNFAGGRVHFRDLDQEMEVLDYSANVHEVFSPSRYESRWNKYDQSFDKSIAAYLETIRADAPPPVPGIAGLLELQFEAGLKTSLKERRPVVLAEEFPIEPFDENE